MFCRVVNGALEYLAKDLGIAENAVLQGGASIYLVYKIHALFLVYIPSLVSVKGTSQILDQLLTNRCQGLSKYYF